MRMLRLLLTLALLLPAAAASAAPDPEYKPQPFKGKEGTFKNAGKVGQIIFYEGVPGPKQARRLSKLAFKPGQPPEKWFARGYFPANTNDVYQSIRESIITPKFNVLLTCEPAGGGPAITLAEMQHPAEGPLLTLTRGDLDGRSKILHARLAKLAPGRYTLKASFGLTYDVHTDGPNWSNARMRLASGELPLEIKP
jgi:hypothetical protein